MSTPTRPWTEEEVARAVAWRRAGMSTLGISYYLGRMRREVEAKLWDAMDEFQTPTEVNWEAELTQGGTNEEIAARTGRKPATVRMVRSWRGADTSDARPQAPTGGA